MVASERQMEAILRRVLVPVEPSPQFVTRLRGRLVRFQGRSAASGWTLALAGFGLILLVAAWMGLALRLVLAFVGIFGLLGPRRAAQARRVRARAAG
jgi:hypothetical protein